MRSCREPPPPLLLLLLLLPHTLTLDVRARTAPLGLASPLPPRRAPPPRAFEGEVAAEIRVSAPQALAFAAYDDVERMPEWAPLLERVRFLDRAARRSEWSVRLPAALFSLAVRCGFGSLVCWQAVHAVEAPRVLAWRSLSGFENEGEVRFEPEGGDGAATRVSLKMVYRLPDFTAPVVQNALVRRFMHFTVRRAMERFRDVVEREAAAAVDERAAAEAEAEATHV
ncbi:hypothetical protein AB1Y20_006384 [Prymnesium parvum]|uniref:Coenzyme Q-binding protein COQ10 START domain-containing protein n=1 Tax=Prymnesium parvum TaxID=97485 RepID=A0AB34J3Y2_PRYPA